jgi:hypothetical protein
MITRGGKPAYQTLSEEESKAEGQCVREDHDGATFMEFVTEDDRAHGFPYSQLMGYTLERVPESEFKGEAPEDRLHLFFSTHDVTLTGWRLRPLVNLVRQGTLASVRALDTRYAQVNTKQPFIARIKIAPVKEG